jgi:hypothetical protein
MDDRYREFREMPRGLTLFHGAFFATIIGGAAFGLTFAMGYEPFKVPDPANGTALLICIGVTAIGFLLGCMAGYADWLAMRRDELIQVAEHWRRQKNDYAAALAALNEVMQYIPESTQEWAVRLHEEAAITPVAEVDIDPDFDPYAISESGPVTRC